MENNEQIATYNRIARLGGVDHPLPDGRISHMWDWNIFMFDMSDHRRISFCHCILYQDGFAAGRQAERQELTKKVREWLSDFGYTKNTVLMRAFDQFVKKLEPGCGIGAAIKHISGADK